MQDVCSPCSKTCLSNKMLFYYCILISKCSKRLYLCTRLTQIFFRELYILNDPHYPRPAFALFTTLQLGLCTSRENKSYRSLPVLKMN